MKIGRTLFWFRDRSEMLVAFNNDFFGLASLLNRLLNQSYEGKKIEFINIHFSTIKTYESHPLIPKDSPYYYGGHLKYYGVFDRKEFENFSKEKQCWFVWDKSHEYLCKSARLINNEKLLDAAENAYVKGIEINLNPDYRVVDCNVCVKGEILRASVWINFEDDGMYSKFTLERSGKIIFEKHLDGTVNGVEFFLDIYKKIAVKDKSIVIFGHKSVDYLPLKIPFSEIPL